MSEETDPVDEAFGTIWTRRHTLFLVVAFVCCAAFVAASARGAPAPVVKPLVELRIGQPGDWSLEWNGATKPMPLGKNGTYAWGEMWEGHYTFDAMTRTFGVVEHQKGGDKIYRWSCVLDQDGCGTTIEGDFPPTKISIRRATAELKPLPKATD